LPPFNHHLPFVGRETVQNEGAKVGARMGKKVFSSGRQPLYVANETNEASLVLAKTVGYIDTGAREFAGEGVCRSV